MLPTNAAFIKKKKKNSLFFFFFKEIEFVDGSLLKLKSYIEVYLEQPVEFKLLLVEMDSEEIVWKAKLRECKCFESWMKTQVWGAVGVRKQVGWLFRYHNI